MCEFKIAEKNDAKLIKNKNGKVILVRFIAISILLISSTNPGAIIDTKEGIKICTIRTKKNRPKNKRLKILLANETTRILHGNEASKKAEKTAKDTFDEGGIGSDLPEIKIDSKVIKKGVSILDFIANNKILHSKSEVRRAIANRGLKIDGVIIDDEKKILQLKDFKKNILKLSYGKKKHYLVKII